MKEKKWFHFFMLFLVGITFFMFASAVGTGSDSPPATDANTDINSNTSTNTNTSAGGDKSQTPGEITPGASLSFAELERRVNELMEEGDIPGLSIAAITADRVYVKGFGYADMQTKQPVTPSTNFEIASTSKAFTALAILKLEKEGRLNLQSPVSEYLPWFYVNFNGEKQSLTIEQCLHHTTGIPFASVQLIPQGKEDDALEKTVRQLTGYELKRLPGTRFEYATINYDILGLIVEKLTGQSYASYMKENIFLPLGMNDTSVGWNEGNDAPRARGYKIGFFKARPYDAPYYRGNSPAGYIVSNAADLVHWLRLQAGLEENDFSALVEKSHRPNRSVPFNGANLSGYCNGWFAYMNGTDIIDHAGNNPNFTAYVGFSKQEKVGVAVLANSNSNYTQFIGHSVLAFLRGKSLPTTNVPADMIDKAGSVISIMMGLFFLVLIAFFVSIFIDLATGSRSPAAITPRKIIGALMLPMIYLPFLYGIYLLPMAMSGVNWETTLVWAPASFRVAVIVLCATLAFSLVTAILSGFFPQKNKYKRNAPLMIVLSLAAGGANAVVIFLVTASVFNTEGLAYQLYYFTLAFALYIIGRKILQTRLINLTFDIIYDIRMNLVEKIFNTSYQKFEKIERGRVLATINDDTGQIANAANFIVMLITSVITIFGAFVYLATIAFWATALTIVVIIAVSLLYYALLQQTRILFEEARDTQNAFLGFLNGLLDGFKELSMHFRKREEYKNDIADVVNTFRVKLSTAFIKFINAFLVGESLLIIILGMVGFGFHRFFPAIPPGTIMSFIMVLLYLIGPFNNILRAMPEIVRMRVSWRRVRDFSAEIPANIDPQNLVVPSKETLAAVEKIEAEGVMFEYKSKVEFERFVVGPVDFSAKKGEIVFIIGGNGSGKSTLGNLLTGLYIPEKGSIKINGEEKASYQVGEYFSVVFSNFHLFEKLYNLDLTGRKDEVRYYLKMLRLDQKVVLDGNRFSTVDLSGGQRKRLALLRCYLEDHPIYLFDEVAADQDPEFRKFFYRDLLMKMKEKGKIVIAITHDDHYFDVADKIIKMDMGKIEKVSNDYRVTAA